MANVPCNGCTQCCQWGAELDLRPRLTANEVGKFEFQQVLNTHTKKTEYLIKADAKGNCIYLGDEGCTLWPDSPSYCRSYDCRVSLVELLNNPGIGPLLKVMIAAHEATKRS